MKDNHTKQVKAPNYNGNAMERLQAVYDPTAAEAVRDAQIVQLSRELGKSTRSVIAKLSTMGLYVPRNPDAAKPSVARSPSRTAIVRDIEAALNMERDALASLGRANKGDLQALHAATVPAEAETEGKD